VPEAEATHSEAPDNLEAELEAILSVSPPPESTYRPIHRPADYSPHPLRMWGGETALENSWSLSRCARHAPSGRAVGECTVPAPPLVARYARGLGHVWCLVTLDVLRFMKNDIRGSLTTFEYRYRTSPSAVTHRAKQASKLYTNHYNVQFVHLLLASVRWAHDR